jgi:sulfopropanediol 3-dehydrogenase
LAQIEERGDDAVRALSRNSSDKGHRPRSSSQPRRSRKAIGQVGQTRLSDDIKFAQAQVRGFAQKQRETMKDLEVETLPGRDPRPPPISGELRSAATSRAGATPMVASAHMSIVTALRRGREAHHRLRAALPWRAASRDRRRDALSAARTISTCSAACRRSP